MVAALVGLVIKLIHVPLRNIKETIDLLRGDIKELFHGKDSMQRDISDIRVNCAMRHGRRTYDIPKADGSGSESRMEEIPQSFIDILRKKEYDAAQG